LIHEGTKTGLRFYSIPENLSTGEGAKFCFKRQSINIREENIMATELSQRIMNNPEYQSLVRERNSFGWWLTLVICVVYYGFIMIIAFDKPLLAIPLAEGWATTWGIPVGFGIILISIILTGVYVYRANKRYDVMTRRILEKEIKS
jgi:uncharacterized membrane protein (DUF485 family)